MKTLPLLAVLLLMLWTPAEGRVANSFTDNNQGCPQFFFPNPAHQNQRIIPSILFGVDTTNYATICQVLLPGVSPWFATLYDKRRRIPVYSAYAFDPNIKSEGKVIRKWKIEPQLDNDHQALDRDYGAHTKSGSHGKEDYTRGHLYPCSYGEGKDGRQSTCTLTNAAPQLASHNGEWATQVEEPLQLEIKGKCKGKAYMVTGVVPSATWLPIKRGTQTVAEGLNVPSYFWTAYCCDGKTVGRVSGARLSKHKDVALKASGFMEKMKVFELENRLHSLYSALFGRMKKRKRGDTDAVPYKLFGGIQGCGGRQ